MDKIRNKLLDIAQRIYIRDIMSRNVLSMDENSSIVEAAKLMKEKDISCVIGKRRSVPAGMLTESDLVKKLVAKSINPRKTKIKDIMTEGLITINFNSPVMKASNSMRKNQIKRLVVVDENNNLVGIVTQTDIIKNFNRIYGNYTHLLWNQRLYIPILILIVALLLIKLLITKKL